MPTLTFIELLCGQSHAFVLFEYSVQEIVNKYAYDQPPRIDKTKSLREMSCLKHWPLAKRIISPTKLSGIENVIDQKIRSILYT
jgi:hypothetical protein